MVAPVIKDGISEPSPHDLMMGSNCSEQEAAETKADWNLMELCPHVTAENHSGDGKMGSVHPQHGAGR